jgi:hypothetical protein
VKHACTLGLIALLLAPSGCTRRVVSRPPLPPLALDPSVHYAHLFIRVRDERGQIVPARVILRPEPGAGYGESLTKGKPSHRTLGSMFGTPVSDGVVGTIDGVLLTRGEGEIPVPPGPRTLVVTHGPAYELAEVRVVLDPDERCDLEVQLARTVDTGGWLSTDPHTHRDNDFDSRLTAERQLASAVANGVDLPMLTEHHAADSFAVAGRRLGYPPEVAGYPSGSEIGVRYAHATVYPLHPLSDDETGGAPQWMPCTTPRRRPRVVEPAIPCIDTRDGAMHLKTLWPLSLVIAAHPVFPRSDLGFLDNLHWGYYAAYPPPSPPPEMLDAFDGMELLSGAVMDPLTVERTVGDWLWLVGSGRRLIGVAGSDSHTLSTSRAGWPRTWLRLDEPVPGYVTEEEISGALHQGRVIASSGPFVRLSVNGGDIGDLVPATSTSLDVRVSVDAAAFIPIDEVIIFLDGVDVARLRVPRSSAHPRFEAALTLPMRPKGDSFVVAVAVGDALLPMEVAGRWGGMPSVAITNPVFVDGDGDGRFQMNGVRAIMPRLFAASFKRERPGP